MEKQDVIESTLKVLRVSKCIYAVNGMRIDTRWKLPAQFASHWAGTRGVYRALMCYYLALIPADDWGLMELDGIICDKINGKSAEVWALEVQSLIL